MGPQRIDCVRALCVCHPISGSCSETTDVRKNHWFHLQGKTATAMNPEVWGQAHNPGRPFAPCSVMDEEVGNSPDDTDGNGGARGIVGADRHSGAGGNVGANGNGNAGGNGGMCGDGSGGGNGNAVGDGGDSDLDSQNSSSSGEENDRDIFHYSSEASF